jgi:hypothetical protein
VETAVRLSRLAEAEGIGTQLALRVAGSMPLVGAYRLLAARLEQEGVRVPLVLIAPPPVAGESSWLHAAARLGSLLCDGPRCGAPRKAGAAGRPARFTRPGRLRGRAEFISLPWCGSSSIWNRLPVGSEKTGH